MEHARSELPSDPQRPVRMGRDARLDELTAAPADVAQVGRPMSQDQAARIERLHATPNENNSKGERAAAERGRQHPAQGARAVALVASIAATAGIGAAMAYADSAQDTDIEIAVPGITSTSSLVFPTPQSFKVPELADLAPSQPMAPGATPAGEPTREAPSQSQTADAVGTEPVVSPGPKATRYVDGVFTGTSEYTRWGNVSGRNQRLVTVRSSTSK